MKLIKDLGMMFPKATSKQKKRYGMYECPICLKIFKADSYNVKNGLSTKCSSCNVSIQNTKHGGSSHKLYNTWKGERSRCLYKKSPQYNDYGGRGIEFNEEFIDFSVWLKYVESLPNAYKDAYTIDRINNDGNYQRGNIRWASSFVQSRNTRKIYKNNTSGFRGVHRSAGRWKSQIRVNNKNIYLGLFDYSWTAAYVYDSYILINGFEHTRNFTKRLKML